MGSNPIADMSGWSHSGRRRKLAKIKTKEEKMNPRALLALLACFSGDQQKVPLQVWTHWGLNPIADMSGWSHSGRRRKLAKIKTKEEKMNPRALLALLACFSGDQQKVPLQVWTHWGLNPRFPPAAWM